MCFSGQGDSVMVGGGESSFLNCCVMDRKTWNVDTEDPGRVPH